MQRFELSDGSSNKFWQIAREGGSLRVTFGKIGTAGQTQLKELSSEAMAIAEHDKLVKEKTKKGYLPVGDVAASATASVKVKSAKPAEVAAPSQASTAVPTAVSVAAEPAETPPAAASVVVAAPGGYVLEERYVGEKYSIGDGTFEGVRAAWELRPGRFPKSCAADLAAGKKDSDKALRPQIEALVRLVETGDGEIDCMGAAMLLRVSAENGAIPYLIARYGIAFTLDAHFANRNLSFERGDGKVTFKATTTDYLLDDDARAIAACEDRVDPADWKKAIERVRAARLAETSRAIRAEYNIVLRDEAFAAEDHAANVTNNDWQVARFVFLATRDRALQKVLAAEVDPALVFQVVGVEAESWVLPRIEKESWLVDSIFDLETVAGAKTLANELSNKKTQARVREYFDKRPDLALRALAPIAASGGKLAPFVKPVIEAALAAHPTLLAIVTPLLDAKAKSYLLAEKKPALPEADVSALPESLRSDPKPGLDGYPKKIAPLPDFATAAIASAPIALENGKAAIPALVVARLVQAVRYLDDSKSGTIVNDVKRISAPKALGAFAWELFERWQAAGAPNKEPWGFTALGVLGDDDSARKLTPLIRAWPGESLHARATVGLDVLAEIGSDVALMHLHGIAQKLKFKGLQEKAREKIAEVASARGFTPDELADRLVPDFDLGDEGGATLDFGSRKFTIAFDESMKPVVVGSDGKVVGDLPKPNKADDAEKANLATERWKALKKDAKTIAASQVLRLELAMCSERRWKADVFQTFLVEHPVVVHLVRRLVWGVYSKAELQKTFRVAEDGTFADTEDEAFTLPDGASVGVVHRLSLDDATLGKWSKVVGDYKILQPFEQLGRTAGFIPTEKERTDQVIDRLGDTEVRTSRLLGLEARGWRKGEAQDAGWVWDMWRPLEGGIVAEFSIEGGICMGAPDMNPSTQKIGPIHFYEKDRKTQVALDKLSKVVVSELAREREALRE